MSMNMSVYVNGVVVRINSGNAMSGSRGGRRDGICNEAREASRLVDPTS